MDDFKFVSVEKKSALLSFYNEFGEDYQLTPVESLDKLATGHICSILIELKTDKKKKFVFPTRFAYEGIGMYLVQRKTDHQAYLDQLKCTSAVHGDEKEIAKFLVVLLHLFNEKHPARISHVINQLSTEAQKEIHDILTNFDISKKSDAFNVLYVSAKSRTNFTGLSDNHQIYNESIKGQEGSEITEEARLEKSSQLVDSDISNGCGFMVSDESSYMETNSDETSQSINSSISNDFESVTSVANTDIEVSLEISQPQEANLLEKEFDKQYHLALQAVHNTIYAGPSTVNFKPTTVELQKDGGVEIQKENNPNSLDLFLSDDDESVNEEIGSNDEMFNHIPSPIEVVSSPVMSEKEDGEISPGSPEETEPTMLDTKLEYEEAANGEVIGAKHAQTDVDDTSQEGAQESGTLNQEQEVFELDEEIQNDDLNPEFVYDGTTSTNQSDLQIHDESATLSKSYIDYPSDLEDNQELGHREVEFNISSYSETEGTSIGENFERNDDFEVLELANHVPLPSTSNDEGITSRENSDAELASLMDSLHYNS